MPNGGPSTKNVALSQRGTPSDCRLYTSRESNAGKFVSANDTVATLGDHTGDVLNGRTLRPGANRSLLVCDSANDPDSLHVKGSNDRVAPLKAGNNSYVEQSLIEQTCSLNCIPNLDSAQCKSKQTKVTCKSPRSLSYPLLISSPRPLPIPPPRPLPVPLPVPPQRPLPVTPQCPLPVPPQRPLPVTPARPLPVPPSHPRPVASPRPLPVPPQHSLPVSPSPVPYLHHSLPRPRPGPAARPLPVPLTDRVTAFHMLFPEMPKSSKIQSSSSCHCSEPCRREDRPSRKSLKKSCCKHCPAIARRMSRGGKSVSQCRSGRASSVASDERTTGHTEQEVEEEEELPSKVNSNMSTCLKQETSHPDHEEPSITNSVGSFMRYLLYGGSGSSNTCSRTRQRRLYWEDDLVDAIDDVHSGMSVHDAAIMHCVPGCALQERIQWTSLIDQFAENDME